MINLKEYIVTLMAMFLSLGIGILVGTSITDSVVVEQQKNIIEQLESRYFQTLEEMEGLSRDIQDRDNLLGLYDLTAEGLLHRDAPGSLMGREVAVLSLDTRRGREICDFLQKYGVRINPHIFLARESQDLRPGQALQEILSLAAGLLEEGGEEGVTLESAAAVFSRPLAPEALLVVLGGILLGDFPEDELKEFLTRVEPRRVVLLEDYHLEGRGAAAKLSGHTGVIDYIDTAPGRMALLMHLTDDMAYPHEKGEEP